MMDLAEMAPEGASHQLHAELCRSRAGRRWERLFHTHERELEALLAVHDDLRTHLAEALTRLLAVTMTRTMDDAAVRATTRVLDDLDRLGTMQLRSVVACLRDDLWLARGCQLDELLGLAS